MRVKNFLVIFALLNLTLCENIFYKKLNKLFDYCLKNLETVDSGTLMGLSFAKGQLMILNGNSPELTGLIKKCEKLQNHFANVESVESSIDEIGDLVQFVLL